MNAPPVCGFHRIHFRAAMDFPCTRGRVRDASRPSLHEWPRTAAFATYTAGEAGQVGELCAVARGLTCIEPGSLFRVQSRKCVSLSSTALASCRGFTSEDAGALHPPSYTGRPPETKEKAAKPLSYLHSRCTSFLFEYGRKSVQDSTAGSSSGGHTNMTLSPKGGVTNVRYVERS